MATFTYKDSEDCVTLVEINVTDEFRDKLLEIYLNEPAWVDYEVVEDDNTGNCVIYVTTADMLPESVAELLIEELTMLGEYYEWYLLYGMS